MATNCQFLKETLFEFLGSAISVTAIRDHCVLTLPQKTVDDRLVSVFVHEKMPGYFLVDDGGKTAAELFAQGIHITDVRMTGLEGLAERYGATFTQGAFRIGCRIDGLNDAIMSISQCATLATWHVLAHKPRFEEEPVLHRIEKGMRAWRPPYDTEIRSRVRILGQKAEHVIDFVSFPLNGYGSTENETDRMVQRVLETLNPRLPVAVKVIRPSDNPLEQARGYGFMAYDLKDTQFEFWPRVAVATRADNWTENALDLVRKSATSVLAVETGREDMIEEQLPFYLTEAVS
jgi:hypothetical protein